MTRRDRGMRIEVGEENEYSAVIQVRVLNLAAACRRLKLTGSALSRHATRACTSGPRWRARTASSGGFRCGLSHLSSLEDALFSTRVCVACAYVILALWEDGVS